MTQAPGDNQPADGPIELAPLTATPIQRHIADTRSTAHSDFPDSALPVPANPAHNCPNCDYILTGLTARRCPECGEPFTMSDARARALELSDTFRALRWKLLQNNAKFWIGLLLLLGGVIAANSVGAYHQGLPYYHVSVRGYVTMAMVPVILMLVWYFKASLGGTGAEVILTAGIIVAVIGGFLSAL